MTEINPVVGTLIARPYHPTTYSPSDYGKITDGGTLGDGNSHPASSNGYATLAALQAVYSFATALTNDMAGLMIQAAINAAHATGTGTVYLPAGKYQNIPNGIIMPNGTNVTLVGDGVTTIILCQACGTNPAITVTGINAGKSPIRDMTFWGFTTFVAASGSAGGTAVGPTPAAGAFYTSGSIGLSLTSVTNVVFPGLQFNNFDTPTSFGTNTYVITFRECVFTHNNKGACVNNAASNSLENMVWTSCNLSNNNYGAYMIFQSNGTYGSGTAMSCDAYISHCSMDFNIVNHIYYLGGLSASNGDMQNTLFVTNCHMETSSGCSGTGTRIFHDGSLVLTACEFYEDGSLPQGMISGGFYAATYATGNKSGGYNYPNFCPLFYSGGGQPINFASHGNFNRIGQNGISVRAAAAGDISSFEPPLGSVIFNSATTLIMQHQLAGMVLITGSCTVTVAADASACNMIIGTVISFTTKPGQTGTFAAASGVTITTSGTGLTFGGTKPATVNLVKIAGNTWVATGQMT